MSHDAPAPRPTSTWPEVYFNSATIPFWGVHVAAVAGVAWLGLSASGIALAIASYYVRMFFVTGGYHRYFSHRTYKTSRAFQFLLAVGAQTTLQKGALWWAANHRHHHKHSDESVDLHSPRHGFWWSHIGWILCRDFEETDYDSIKDLSRFPELRWLNRNPLICPAALTLALYLVGGTFAVVWGFAVSTVLLWHGTFTINSLSHVLGSRRYETPDDSTNNPILAIVTMGEGWHNNHHHFMNSARQGFRWYQIDLTYYVLRVLALARVVWSIKEPPPHILTRQGAGKRDEREARMERSARSAESPKPAEL